MTPAELAALHGASGLRLPAAPADALRVAEDAADRRPADLQLDALVRELHRHATAGDGLPPHVAGVRRERLIRWDAETTTWEGFTADGTPAVVRVLRPHAARDPVLRRALLRTAAALEPACPGIAPIDGAWPALVLAVPGPAVPAAQESGDGFPLARWLATGVAALRRWEAAGLGLPRLAPEEWRHGASGLSLACLTPAPTAGHAENLALLARLLGADDDREDAVSAAVGALAAAPPRRIGDAAAQVVRAFAEELARARHRLVASRATSIRAGRHAGALAAVRRLIRAAPPPTGRGAVGVDLDGRVTVLESDGTRITWGPPGAEELAWSAEGDADPAIVRRLLRARAAAAPSPRLQKEIGGDAAVVEALTRWLAAALRLRTTRLLLEKDAG